MTNSKKKKAVTDRDEAALVLTRWAKRVLNKMHNPQTHPLIRYNTSITLISTRRNHIP